MVRIHSPRPFILFVAYDVPLVCEHPQTSGSSHPKTSPDIFLVRLLPPKGFGFGSRDIMGNWWGTKPWQSSTPPSSSGRQRTIPSWPRRCAAWCKRISRSGFTSSVPWPAVMLARTATMTCWWWFRTMRRRKDAVAVWPTRRCGAREPPPTCSSAHVPTSRIAGH